MRMTRALGAIVYSALVLSVCTWPSMVTVAPDGVDVISIFRTTGSTTDSFNVMWMELWLAGMVSIASWCLARNRLTLHSAFGTSNVAGVVLSCFLLLM